MDYLPIRIQYVDLIVLDDNVLIMNPSVIDKARVVMTFFNGKFIYEQPVL